MKKEKRFTFFKCLAALFSIFPIAEPGKAEFSYKKRKKIERNKKKDNLGNLAHQVTCSATLQVSHRRTS